MIIKTPSNYRIVGKNIVIITSAIITKSLFTPEERYQQSFKSIESVRLYIPECTIVFVEMSDIPEEWMEKLSSMCDYFIFCGQDVRLQEINAHTTSSPGEIALLREVISHLENPEKIYKLSGRYYLKESVPLEKFNYKKYNFLIGYDTEKVFHTTFYSMPVENIDFLIEVLDNSYKMILSQPGTGVEKAYARLIPEYKINLLPYLACEGYIAGRFGGKKTLYQA